MSARRVGILGGTFDPIHCGHLDLAAAAQRALGLAKVYVVPSCIPPHRPQPIASVYHRFAMAAMAVEGHPSWRVSDLELRVAEPSFTTTTLARFRDRGYAPGELFFILGADAFLEIGSWRNYPRLLEQAHFAVVSRPGLRVDQLPRRLPDLAPRMAHPPLGEYDQLDTLILLIDAATADVSSTAIRQCRLTGLPTGGMVPPLVQQHIEQHGLYTPRGQGRRLNDAPPR